LEAVQAAILTAAAFGCEISHTSRFERKHYAYADLPLGYQVTQQRWPIAKRGLLKCRRKVNPKMKQKKKQKDEPLLFVTVGIDRIQLEQDTGKTIAITKREVSTVVVVKTCGDCVSRFGNEYAYIYVFCGRKCAFSNYARQLGRDGTEQVVTESLVDLNRAGCALVEIVFNPDIRSANDASSVVSTLRDTMRYIGTCDGRMEEGSLRCDLNISIAPLLENTNANANKKHAFVDADNPFQDFLPPGTGHRVEVKNLNSMKQGKTTAAFLFCFIASIDPLVLMRRKCCSVGCGTVRSCSTGASVYERDSDGEGNANVECADRKDGANADQGGSCGLSLHARTGFAAHCVEPASFEWHDAR
jgi:aspartyl-tRNA(Asn)/glutamyl-tRNA(Gln) amidotransferase subunit B